MIGGGDGRLYHFPGPGERRNDRAWEEETPEPYKPFFLSSMQGYEPPPRPWLVDGIILRGTVSLVTGPPKIGKTQLLQQMACSLAMGMPWLGHETVRCNVQALLTEEEKDEVIRRSLAIARHLGIELMDFEDRLVIEPGANRDCTLVEFDRSDKMSFRPLWHQLWASAAANESEVVIIDPSGVIFGGSENNKRQVTQLIRALQKKASEINGAVILSQHPAKADPKAYSGSAAWLGSVRMGMNLSRPADYDPEAEEEKMGSERERVLTGLGGNYVTERLNDPLIFDDDVLQIDERRRPKPHQRMSPTELEYRLLTGMRRLIANGVRIPADESARDSLANRVRRSPDSSINKTPFNELYGAQARMLQDGKLVRVMLERRCFVRPSDVVYPGEQPWTTDAL